MYEVAEWISEHALAIALGSVLFVAIAAAFVIFGRHKGPVDTDNDSGVGG